MTKHPDKKTEPKSESGAAGPFAGLMARLLLDERSLRYLLLGVLSLLLTIIIIPKGGFIPDDYAVGDIATRDVKAARDMLIPDRELTEKKRIEAQEAVPALYDYDPRIAVDIAVRLSKAIAVLHRTPAATEGVSPEVSPAELLGFDPTVQELEQLAALPAGDEQLRRLEATVSEVLSAFVVGNLEIFASDRQHVIMVRNLVSGDEIPLPRDAEILGFDQVSSRLERKLGGLYRYNGEQRRHVAAVVQKMLRPDLTFNQSETDNRRRLVAESVKPVLFQFKKGEMIVREGERVNEEQVKKLKALAEFGNDYSSFRSACGLILAIGLLFYSVHQFAKRNVRKYRPSNRDLLFLSLTCAVYFVALKVGIFISTALESAFPFIESSSYFYLLPFAAGAVLVRIIINSETALVFTVIVAVLVGILFSNNLFWALYALIGSLLGAHSVRQCTERSILFRAGLRLGVVNLLLVLAIQLLVGHGFDGQVLFKLIFGFAGGLICAVLVTGTVPLVEALFEYTTDIKLLELANMNNPLLRELMIQAPGTYHHSVVVGNLVEAAAEAINANPLLARVAAYYHDIGKSKKPLYFIENQRDQDNKHDKLAPSMSALVLAAHVKDGVEMAREHSLGEPLVAIIQ